MYETVAESIKKSYVLVVNVAFNEVISLVLKNIPLKKVDEFSLTAKAMYHH